jgi:outer membrane protein OmpA-like peptidoglycan-associated protein
MRHMDGKKQTWFLGVLILSGVWLLPASLSSFAADPGPAIQITKRVFPLDVVFGEGKAILKRGPHNEPVLESFGKELNKTPFIHLEIEGNPDTQGSEKVNRSLSEHRAEALRDTFAELYGVPPGRMQVHAAGETQAEAHAASTGPQSRPVLVIVYRLEPSR